MEIHDKKIHLRVNPFIQLSYRIQMPLNNLLLVSRKTNKVKKTESSRALATPIHAHSTRDTEDIPTIRIYGRLRSSIINERKKRILESSMSFCSISGCGDIPKAKSEVLKKDLEIAFKKMIVRKKLVPKQKQLKDSQIVKNACKQTQQNTKSEYSQEAIKLCKTFYSKRQKGNVQTQASLSGGKLKLYLTRQHFRKLKEGEIKPWDQEPKRYRTQTNEGKSGEITDWLQTKTNN